jgi:hypothetical protein
MYEREKIDFLADRLGDLEELVKSSFIGASRELDDLQETVHEQQKIIKEFTKVLDVHFDLIRVISRK